jgi:hypothetical protein
MNKKILIGSILAVALLTLVSFSSAVGYNVVKNTKEENITDEWDFEYCKNYLFETLVKIADNEDIRDLTNSNNEVSLSVEKLDFIYNIGLKMIDRLGEDKVAEILENVEIDNPEILEQLDTIIMSDEELSERVNTLYDMNSKKVSIADFPDYPIICFISLILIIIPYAIMTPVWVIEGILLGSGNIILQIFALLLALITSPITGILLIVGFFYFTICEVPYITPF